MPEQLLSGWGRAVWSRATVSRPTSPEMVTSDVRAARAPTIARGLGRSYGDQAACAGGHVLDMTALTDVARPDQRGRITTGAGVSIEALLRRIVPAGWFVPVTPGTRQVTVGGAVAADIHGKNHHVDGTFCSHLDDLTLVLGDGAVVRCSPTADPELFWATAGGLGLTGVIVEATLRLVPIETSRLLVDTLRLDDLDELLAAMIEVDRTAPYSVAWVDLMARRVGRSILTTARFARRHELAGSDARVPLQYEPGPALPTPRRLPDGLLTSATVRAFNEAWFRISPRRREGEVQSIGRYFHPLDGVRDWNRVYGSGGLVQWQMVVPDGAEAVLSRCVEALTASATPCFLAVLKRFGPANPGPLSFPLEGWTLAVDMPARHPGLAAELDELDRLVADCGGRVYLAKDARLDPALVPVMYPRLPEWQAVRRRVDPHQRFASDLSRRLHL